MKKVNFGVIGFGFMGKTHVKNIQMHPNAEVKSIFTMPDVPIDIKGVNVYTDKWQSVIDDKEIDAVVIATPTDTHCEIAEYAADAGKHIFLEKPMARSIEEADRIINAVKKNGVKLFVGHVLRFFPAYRKAKESISNSLTEIGKIRMIRATRFSSPPSWSLWFMDEKRSGGCILDLSIHDIDYAMWLMNDVPHTIYCEARKAPEKNINAWAASFTTLQFKEGLAHLEASWLGTSKFAWWTDTEIIGTEGIIKFDSKSGIPLHVYGEDEETHIDPYKFDGYYYEMNSFINSIINNSDPLVDGEQGKKAVAVCLAAIKSAEEGRPIKIEEVLG